MAVREAHAPERWQVTLLRVMAGSLTIKTPLRLTCGRKMILGTTFPACFWLRWVPKLAELRPPAIKACAGMGRSIDILAVRTPLKMASATRSRRKEITRS